MPYLILEDFSAGVDLRKSSVSAKPGTLRKLTNAFINVGGEIEKRKTITAVGTLPIGQTFGLGFRNNRLAVFGTLSAGSVGTLPDFTDYYQLIPSGGTPNIERVLDVSPYSSGVWVIARFDDDTIRHFYVDGATANEVTAAEGTNARTHQTKLYIVDGRNLRFSAIGDPDNFAGTGSGVIDVAQQDTGSTELVGIEQYYSYLALFARNAVQLWQMDVDPAKNALIQVLGNIGLVAPNAAAKYGNGDVLFLSDTGVRSLRARDSSNAAVLNDIGSPIDPRIAEKRGTLTPADAEKITGLVDPLTGHFWLVWGGEIFVLAYYPNSRVTAWSTFLPNITVDYTLLANSRVAFRSGDALFVYGSVPESGSPFDPNVPLGTSAALYDSTRVEVELPPIDVSKPATDKSWHSIDVACEGVWAVYVNPDPIGNDGNWSLVATIDGPTYNKGSIALNMRSTHLSVRLVSSSDGPAKVSRVVVHFDDGSSDHSP